MSDISTLFAESEDLKDQGKLDEAIAKLHEALAIDDSHVLSHLALAVLYGRVDQHDKACEHGEKACELEPSEAFNYTAMSVTYQRAWQGTQKQEFITKAEDAMAKAHEIQGTGPRH
jgi:tetratricopeptide (TPR) repeat protein